MVPPRLAGELRRLFRSSNFGLLQQQRPKLDYPGVPVLRLVPNPGTRPHDVEHVVGQVSRQYVDVRLWNPGAQGARWTRGDNGPRLLQHRSNFVEDLFATLFHTGALAIQGRNEWNVVTQVRRQDVGAGFANLRDHVASPFRDSEPWHLTVRICNGFVFGWRGVPLGAGSGPDSTTDGGEDLPFVAGWGSSPDKKSRPGCPGRQFENGPQTGKQNTEPTAPPASVEEVRLTLQVR